MPTRRETMQTMLNEIEWDEGLTMPVANAQNKQLEDELLHAQNKMVAMQNQFKENEDRVNAMTSHLKNVRQELLHTQILVDARKKEILTEDHMMKLALREDGRLRQEIIKVDHDLNTLKEQKNISENNIFRQMQQLEQMKAQMNWDQQALEAWLEESARKDEDTMTLQKYAREDESKVKELALKIAHLTDNAQARRRMLDHETMETHTAQIELDKTAEEFRKCHLDRENLISQWEHTIEQMRHRDNEMDYLTKKLVTVKDEVRKHEETIREKQQFYENEIENNKEQERKISLAERTAAKLRSDYQALETERDQFQSEMDALKRTVDRTALDLETTRSTITQIKKDVADKMTALDRAKDQHDVLVEKLKLVEESTLSAEENAARMDEMMSAEEAAQSALTEEMRRLRDIQFKKTQELHKVKTEEKNCMAQIQGSRAAIRNLNSKINVLDNDSLKQQEIIYNEDYQIQQLERRINRMQGEQSNEEKQAMEAKIKQLNDELEKKVAIHDVLTLQLKRLQEDIRRIRLVADSGRTERASLVNKVEEIELHNENSQRELIKTRSNKQGLMVDKNVLKLETRRLRRLLYSKADEVLTLEQRKLQLATAMQERHREIEVHKDMLLAQMKSANEERSQISAELHERISMIDKLRKRYEIQIMSMAPPEGEEERSQAYYVIKAAQEKEELQREGDELDAKIRKAEKEIRALENTLRLMNSRNETYRKSFNNVSDSSDEMDQKLQLEEQLRAVMDKYKYKRRQIRELNDDLQTMSNTLDNLLADGMTYVDMIDEKQGHIKLLDKELASQQTKLDRVNKQNSRYAREVRSAQKAKGPTVDEQDYDLRQLRDMNKQAMKQMSDVMKVYPDVAPTVATYFEQANMTPPLSHYSGSSVGSDTSSVRSGSSRHSSTASSARSSARSSVQSSAKSLSLSVQGIELAQGVPGSGRNSSTSSRHSKR